MVVMASTSPVSVQTNYTYFTMADGFLFTGYEPAQGASLLINETPLSVKVVNAADSSPSVTMSLDGGPDLGPTTSSSGGTTTVSYATSGPLASGPHTVTVVANGFYGDVTNSWTFNVHETTSDKLWNINIAGGASDTLGNVTDGVIAVAPSSGANHWNNLTGTYNTSPVGGPAVTNSFSGITDANGANPIALNVRGTQAWGVKTGVGSGNSPPIAVEMFRGWVGANVPMNITNTVSGLDYHNSYDLYLYSSWGWTENTVNYEVIDGYGDSLSGSVTETRANILGHAADDYSGCVEGQNYIVISNVTPTVAGEIVFTGKCNDGIMSGLQIREHPGAGYLPPAKILSITDGLRHEQHGESRSGIGRRQCSG
jgi:hypothetical protein